jgi:hypothetical protein
MIVRDPGAEITTAHVRAQRFFHTFLNLNSFAPFAFFAPLR